MSRSPSTRFLQGLGILSAVMLGQAILPAPPDTLLWSVTLDAGHVPLFALMTYGVLRFSRACFPHWRLRFGHYLVAFAVTVVLGFLTEGAQMFVARNANLMDQERNLLGGAAALAVAMSFDRELLGSHTRWRPALRALAVVLVAVAWMPPVLGALSYFERDAAFPALGTFDHAWEKHYRRVRDAQVDVVDPPPGFGTAHGHVGKITYQPTWYPAFVLRGLHPDWTGYDRLVFEVYSPADTTLTLGLRIDDALHDENHHDRFHRPLTLQPGVNPVSIELEDVRTGLENRTMNMQRLRSIALFAYHPEQPFSVYVDSFRLERDAPPDKVLPATRRVP